jgi:hypothetical protein
LNRFVVVVVAGLISVALLAAPASANHTLAHKVSKLQAKMNCLGKMPVTSFFDAAFYDPFAFTDGDAIARVAQGDTLGVPNVALWWTYGTGEPVDAFVVAVKPSQACRAKFPTLSDPLALRQIPHRRSIYATKVALR